MNGLFSIKNYVIIITGAGRGNGKAVAKGLAENGAIVYCLDINFDKNENHTKNDRIHNIVCDITNIEKFKEICQSVYNEHNKIDGLVNNAGVTFTKNDNELYPENHWNKTIEVNLKAPFLCSQIVCELMSQNNSGSIVNITSIASELGFPNNPAYVASKGGLKMLTKAFARDWGRKGIRFNNIGPGYMVTDMTKNSYKNKITKEQREKNIILKRWGRPDDLVGPCIFLLSEASAYITGQDIYVDGGWTANGLLYID